MMKKLHLTCNTINDQLISTINQLHHLKFISFHCHKKIDKKWLSIISKCTVEKVIFYAEDITKKLLHKLEIPSHENEIIFCLDHYVYNMDRNIIVYPNTLQEYQILLTEEPFHFETFMNEYHPSYLVFTSKIKQKDQRTLDLSQYTQLKGIKNDVKWLSIKYPSKLDYVSDSIIPSIDVSQLSINQTTFIGDFPTQTNWLSMNNSLITLNNIPNVTYLSCLFSKLNFEINEMLTLTQLNITGTYYTFDKLTNLKVLTTDGIANPSQIHFPTSLTKLQLESSPNVYCTPTINHLKVRLSQPNECNLHIYTNLSTLQLDGIFSSISIPTTITKLKLLSVTCNELLNFEFISLSQLKIVDCEPLTIYLPTTLQNLSVEKSNVIFKNVKNIHLHSFSIYECDVIELDAIFNSIEVQHIFNRINKTPIVLNTNGNSKIQISLLKNDEKDDFDEKGHLSDNFGFSTFYREFSLCKLL